MLIHSPNELAQYYRDQRKQRNISQTDIAEEIVIRQDTVSKFENKPENVRLDTIFRLLAALDLELHIVPADSNIIEKDETKGWTEKW